MAGKEVGISRITAGTVVEEGMMGVGVEVEVEVVDIRAGIRAVIRAGTKVVVMVVGVGEGIRVYDGVAKDGRYGKSELDGLGSKGNYPASDQSKWVA